MQTIPKDPLRAAQHYPRMFFKVAREEGISQAVRAARNVVRGKPHLNRLGLSAPTSTGPSADYRARYLPDLSQPAPSAPTDFVLIVSDTGIDQCITYRLHQKAHFLRQLGLRCMAFSSHSEGLILSYAELASYVIIYRTAVPERLLDGLVHRDCTIYFEVDDLVLGAQSLNRSGIAEHLSAKQVRNISQEADALGKTASRCDALIVSTEKLKNALKREATMRLRTKPYYVINNFLNFEPLPPPASKDLDFAFTSPSTSTSPEIRLVLQFLSKLDTTASRVYRFVVAGNAGAYDALRRQAFSSIEVVWQDYLPYDAYRDFLTRIKFVLAPLSPIPFNECKTAIRALDSLAAGALPFLSPVGEYERFRTSPALSRLLVADDQWTEHALAIDGFDQQFASLLTACQADISTLYGEVAAIRAYREVFCA